MAHTPPEPHRRGLRPGLRPALVAAAIATAVATALSVTLALMPRPRVESGGAHPAPTALVVFIGNSFTEGSALDSGEDARFPSRIAGDLEVRWIALTADAAGYVAPGAFFQRFGTLALQVPADADLVVLLGSDEDARFGYSTIRFAAEAAFAAVEAMAPDATLLAVGTPWVGAAVPFGVLTSRDAVRDAAVEAGVIFVDPIAEGWWAAGGEAQLDAYGLHPTDLGHAKVAQRLEPLVRELLAQPRNAG